jgi:hypothetical protein
MRKHVGLFVSGRRLENARVSRICELAPASADLFLFRSQLSTINDQLSSDGQAREGSG